MAYSKDLRQKALNYLETGHSAEECQTSFRCSIKNSV
ncbi:IS630 transposase-related protein [Candidatus Protochlamydia sp. W-9]|nr:IS630 transposase-related protein [Candidatus Protochlamydia sp. W-9]